MTISRVGKIRSPVSGFGNGRNIGVEKNNNGHDLLIDMELI